MPRLVLDLEVDGASSHDGDGLHVTGTVRSEGRPDIAFTGWVGLLAILQHVLTAPAVEPAVEP